MTQQQQQIHEIEFFWYENNCCCRPTIQQSLNTEVIPSPLQPFWTLDTWQDFAKEYNQITEHAQTGIRSRERWIFVLWLPCWCLALAGIILTAMTEEWVEHVDSQTGQVTTTRDYDVHILLPFGFGVCFVAGFWLFAYQLYIRKQFLTDPLQALARKHSSQQHAGLAVVAHIPNQIRKSRKRRYVIHFLVASTNHPLPIMATV